MIEGFDKNKMIDDINEMVGSYYKGVKMPPMNMTIDEWNKLLHVIESHLLAHNLMDKYEVAVKNVVNDALIRAQNPTVEEFNMDHVKRSLYILRQYQIFVDEVYAMVEELTENTKKK